MSLYDQPDYSGVSHESCEDAVPSCPICGEETHVEATCPMLNCERCGQHAAWNEIDHDSNVCHDCEPICKCCEKPKDDIVRGWCGSCARAARAEALRELREDAA